MSTLLSWIRAWGHWLVFLLLEGISLVLLLRFNSYQGSVWFTQANTVTAKILSWGSQVSAYSNLGEVNRQLTETNISLQTENETLRQRLAVLEHDSSLTERTVTRQLAGIKRIPAQVIDNSIRNKDNYITINRGYKDGVQNEMGVVCGTGIVGIVCEANKHYAVIQPVLNSKSSISCRLKNSEYFGYLKWEGGNPLRAFIDDIPRHARIKIGEQVETSGVSSVFPPGIFIGKVKRILNSEDGLSYKLEIRLSTDFAKLREVNVIEYKTRTEAE